LLNVQLTAPNPAGGPALRFNTLHEMKAMVFSGQISPSSITYIRELISTDGAGNIDVALFSGPRANYTVDSGNGRVTVTDNVGTDGIDTLFNIERLRFTNADGTFSEENSPVPSVLRNVPNVVNQTQAQATTTLTTAAGQFLVVVATANSNTILAGRVISQNPAGGTQAVIGSTVGIVVSLGPLLVPVPNVVGSTLAGATTSLQSLGFVVTSTTVSNAAPAGQVLTQNPAPGNAVFGSTVALTVSAGPAVGGLVAAFGFEEAAGNQVVDSSPNPIALAATSFGSRVGANPTRTALGKSGRGISFTGNNFVQVNDPGAASKLDLTTGMTLEAWVNPTSMSGWESVLYKERGGAGTGLLSYALYAHDGGTNTPPAGYVRTSAAGPDRLIQGLTRLPLNVWSHIAVTYTTQATAPAGSTLRFYVNGVLVRTVTGANQPIQVGNQPLRIGDSNASITEGFNGVLDELRIYNRALTAAEIVADMNVPIVQ